MQELSSFPHPETEPAPEMIPTPSRPAPLPPTPETSVLHPAVDTTTVANEIAALSVTGADSTAPEVAVQAESASRNGGEDDPASLEAELFNTV